MEVIADLFLEFSILIPRNCQNQNTDLYKPCDPCHSEVLPDIRAKHAREDLEGERPCAILDFQQEIFVGLLSVALGVKLSTSGPGEPSDHANQW